MLLVARRAGWQFVERSWHGLRGGLVRVEVTLQADLEVAASIGERLADQEFSLVDRTSFAVMHRSGIARVASFDKDFAMYRFGSDRRKAFDMVVEPLVSATPYSSYAPIARAITIFWTSTVPSPMSRILASR